jgi:hypothetical protein
MTIHEDQINAFIPEAEQYANVRMNQLKLVGAKDWNTLFHRKMEKLTEHLRGKKANG